MENPPSLLKKSSFFLAQSMHWFIREKICCFWFRIKEKTSKSLKEKYDQMYTLFRFLPLMLSDLVPEGNSVWAFLLDFFNLVEMLLSPAFDEDDISILGVLVHNHLNLFSEVFPHSSVIFKQHHLIHYPTVIRSCGPLLYLSVLRYERKPQFFFKIGKQYLQF